MLLLELGLLGAFDVALIGRNSDGREDAGYEDNGEYANYRDHYAGAAFDVGVFSLPLSVAGAEKDYAFDQGDECGNPGPAEQQIEQPHHWPR